jgi:peroxiredoxin
VIKQTTTQKDLMRIPTLLVAATIVLAALACDGAKAPGSEAPAPSSAKALPEAPQKEVAPAATHKSPPSETKVEAKVTSAAIGKEAPAFALPDLSGKTHKLSDYRGKPVVLEWFNPECPFVKAAHTKGSLVRTAAELEKKGFVYLAINSGAPGKQGHGTEANSAGKESFGLTHPILLDEAGATGKAYGATNTPHTFVIDQKGTLVYSGAVDNSPDGEGKSPERGTLVNYLTQATEELLAGKPISMPSTKVYGCSVKYAK